MGSCLRLHWVQWYEYTGVLGEPYGCYWQICLRFLPSSVTGVSILQQPAGADFYVIVVTITPILLSYYLYYAHGVLKKAEAVEFVVVQPNIDPYTEKFAGTAHFIPFEDQGKPVHQLVRSADYTQYPVCNLAGNRH